ncbi:CBM_HP2_G0032320.mRNA.1.CDS.1 [Saccharomyces cerevisiae]|nr:CBM_HP2_G0032320.mRNA.1.CDS.1 [Saccharomyces cerevisiae]CAI6586611.1 CBM_HP2_G0032320.mRNA.1.CDS.1 [Saccharomyces cerevisiae]
MRRDNAHNYITGKAAESSKQQRSRTPHKETSTRINDQDTDLSIQEEILGGNFKLRGRKTQVSILIIC